MYTILANKETILNAVAAQYGKESPAFKKAELLQDTIQPLPSFLITITSKTKAYKGSYVLTSAVAAAEAVGNHKYWCGRQNFDAPFFIVQKI